MLKRTESHGWLLSLSLTSLRIMLGVQTQQGCPRLCADSATPPRGQALLAFSLPLLRDISAHSPLLAILGLLQPHPGHGLHCSLYLSGTGGGVPYCVNGAHLPRALGRPEAQPIKASLQLEMVPDPCQVPLLRSGSPRPPAHSLNSSRSPVGGDCDGNPHGMVESPKFYRSLC